MSSERCEYIQEILLIERDIIEQHSPAHQRYNGIQDEYDALVDFVSKYAWIMREVFCGVMCSHRDTCKAVEHYKNGFLDDISDGEIEEHIKKLFVSIDRELLIIKLRILKHDISTHKWLNNIDNYGDAIRDFLLKYGWVIQEIYQKSKEK